MRMMSPVNYSDQMQMSTVHQCNVSDSSTNKGNISLTVQNGGGTTNGVYKLQNPKQNSKASIHI